MQNRSDLPLDVGDVHEVVLESGESGGGGECGKGHVGGVREEGEEEDGTWKLFWLRVGPHPMVSSSISRLSTGDTTTQGAIHVHYKRGNDRSD